MTPTLVKHAPIRKLTGRESSGAPNATAVLAIILACYLMIVLDISVIIAALPKIHSALHFSPRACPGCRAPTRSRSAVSCCWVLAPATSSGGAACW